MDGDRNERPIDEPAELAALLDNARHAIIVKDLEGRVVFWNRGAERIYGWAAAEAVGKRVDELTVRKEILSQHEQAQREVIEKGEWSGELRETTRQGKEVVVEACWTLARGEDGRPRSIHIVCTDITYKKAVEDRLFRSQRLESIGMLTAEIAHDFNNVLSPILMAIEALRLQLRDEESHFLLAMLKINTERGAGLIDRMLAYVNGRDSSHVVIRPEYLIEEVAWVVNRIFPDSVQLSVSLQDGLWPVTGDFTQLYQVLFNLCLNARDAMPEGGRITIKAENAYRDENNKEAPARYLVISVADTGMGIAAEIIGRVFDPFFTTKEPGKGTGLGLATVARIVKTHDGFMEVSSEDGRGAEFRVYLPARHLYETVDGAYEQATPPSGQGESILLLDNDLVFREFSRTVLENFGYEVVTAGNGMGALGLYARYKERFKVVVTELTMPDMSGLELIDGLKDINPAAKIIVISGLSTKHKLVRAARMRRVNRFLHKPFTAARLLNSLEEILNAE